MSLKQTKTKDQNSSTDTTTGTTTHRQKALLPSEEDFESEIKCLEEYLNPNHHQNSLPSLKGVSTNYKQYQDYKMERDKALVLRLLDSTALDSMGINSGSAGMIPGPSQEAQMDISSFLSNENAYDLLAECIIHPSRKIIMTNNNDIDNNNDTVVIQTKDEHLHIKRSYRAMILLVNDAMKASNIRRDQGKTFDHSDDSIFKDLILDNTRAGLLTKKIFAAYKRCIEQDGINNSMDEEEEETFNHCPSELSLLPHIPHLNKLLQALIDGFPSAVIGASCVGGKSGIDISLKPMLSLQQIPESASPYPTFTQIVTRGCTGRLCGEQQQPISMQQQQQQYPSMGNINQTFISKGHRRKFVRSLSEWGLLTFLIHKITNDSSTTNIPTTVDEWNNNNHDISFDAEIACDALITIVESVCYPPLNNNKEKKQMLDESVGEEALLSPLASDELVQQLAGCAMDVHSPFAVTASRALLQLFELATGRSKKSQPPPAIDATEEDIVDDSNRSSSSSSTSSSTTTTTEKTTIPPEKNNKLLKSGLTTTMHTKLISNITLLIEGLCIHHHHQQQQEEEINTTKEYSNHVISEPVSHPGGYIIEHPFTSRRLNLITLLADILNYEDHEVMNGSVKRTSINGQLCYTSSCTALDTIMKLPMFSPPVVDGGTTTTTSSNNNDDSTVIYNPWPTLCDLVFAYPENNLYQIQFYRLLHALCMTNHEASLKMVVQKSKFVSRAISTCKDSNCTSLYGVLLRCLNALRLHSQSLSPRSFLRNYLDSHDGWKDFQTDLRRMTMEQQLRGGGIHVPNITTTTTTTAAAINNNDCKLSGIDIDLGSSYANELGFDSTWIRKFVESVDSSTESSSSSKKKKKKNKKKKKKVNNTNDK